MNDLTEKEKETLRLMAQGHDAKSAARELSLSVHTINERLRASRRKLGVTSSREASRRLLQFEAQGRQTAPKNLGYKTIGDAKPPVDSDPSSTVHQGQASAIWIRGAIVMSLVILTLAAAFSGALAPQDQPAPPLTAELTRVDPAPEQAARAWLQLVDEFDWQASFDAAGQGFQKPNTAAGWKAASQQVRTPLGAVASREIIKSEFVNAPPKGFTLVLFMTQFENGSTAIETITLEREPDGLKVVGYLIE